MIAREEESESALLGSQINLKPSGRSSLVLNSRAMLELFDRAKRISRFPSTVLIEGETGVGKEVLANWLHEHGPRFNMPFTKVNCASIPESLLESELFGYERGAFTGAKREGHPGLFEVSDKGTLLLDEIGELPPSMQAKLLRVLQDREVRRVGGSWSRNIDVRIIASTNQNLRNLVKTGQFREDLYYRLNVVNLYIPPLRERRADIAPLLRYFFAQIANEFKLDANVSDEVLSVLVDYDYPGNVRELRNLVEALIISTETDGSVISLDHLPLYVRRQPVHDKSARPDSGRGSVPGANQDSTPRDSGEDSGREAGSLQEQLLAAERRIIVSALATASSVRQCAKTLGISHSTLIRKMTRHNITV